MMKINRLYILMLVKMIGNWSVRGLPISSRYRAKEIIRSGGRGFRVPGRPRILLRKSMDIGL